MYDKKLIYDYIMGNDIEEYDIEELENDSVFMQQVIDFTNDKNMYSLCGEKVKNNFDFVIYIINKFEDDSKFIIEVANEYIKNNKTEDFNPNCAELNIIMSDIGKKKNEDEFFMFSMSRVAFQEYTLSQVELVKQKLPNEDFGLGFYIIQSMHYNNPIIIEYFAKKYIVQIFKQNEDYTLEELIHKDINKFELAESSGINNYLINYIRRYDIDLASYLCCHVELLDKVKKSMETVKCNWENFSREQSIRKFELFEKSIILEFSKYENESSFVETQLIDYVIQKCDLIKKDKVIAEYIKLRNEEEYVQDYLLPVDEQSLSFVDRKILNFAMEKASEIFSKHIIGIKEYEKTDYIEKKVNKPKIIKLQLKNNII